MTTASAVPTTAAPASYEVPNGPMWLVRDTWTEANRHLIATVPQPRPAGLRDDPADHVRRPVRVRLRRSDLRAGLLELRAVRGAGHLRPDRRVRFGVHQHRHRRGHAEGLHRPAPVAADLPVRGPDRPHLLRPAPQHLHVRDHVGRRHPRRLPPRGWPGRRPPRDPAAAGLRLRLQLDPGADRPVGEVGRGGELRRLHLDVPDDVRLLGLRLDRDDAVVARAASPTRTRSPS